MKEKERVEEKKKKGGGKRDGRMKEKTEADAAEERSEKSELRESASQAFPLAFPLAFGLIVMKKEGSWGPWARKRELGMGTCLEQDICL